MPKKSTLALMFLTGLLNIFIPSSFAESDRTEPGPDISTWVITDESVETQDIDVIYRTYEDPNDKKNEARTYSLRIDGRERIYVKIWNIRNDDLSRAGVDDFSVESALLLPGGRWFIGDKGKFPSVGLESGTWGDNLVIDVYKLDKKGLTECVREKEGLKKNFGIDKSCTHFFREPGKNGMHLSIPIGKYNYK